MIAKLLTEHHLEDLSLKGGCRGSFESTHVKIPHCWKSHATAAVTRVKMPHCLTSHATAHTCQNATLWKISCHGSHKSKCHIVRNLTPRPTHVKMPHCPKSHVTTHTCQNATLSEISCHDPHMSKCHIVGNLMPRLTHVKMPGLILKFCFLSISATSTVDGIGNTFHCIACRIQCHSTNQASICSDTECICIPHDM